MKKKFVLDFCKLALTLNILAGWWGLIYPEFAFTEGDFKVCVEDAKKDVNEREYVESLLRADRSQIRFKSKFYTRLEEMLRHWE